MPNIRVTFPDRSVKEFDKGITPLKIAESLGKRLAADALAAKVDGKLADLNLPLEHDCSLKILTFDDKEGKDVFRHSTAHVFAHAVKRLYPEAKNTIGPPVEEGFFYDYDDLKITPEDFSKIEAEMKKIVQENLPTQRVILTMDEVRKLWSKSNPYKVEMAQEFKDAGFELSAYKQGEFIDLCEGPHVPSTGYIKAFKLSKLAGAYWRGDVKNKQLTRIYGISFPSDKMLKDYEHVLEEAAKRDHRKIGQELELFMVHEWSPGSPFILPKGNIIYQSLLQFIREEYRKRGYQEVVTPQMFNKALWELSGHWDHYQENMFLLNVDTEQFSLKPMNCPSHVLIFKNKTRSYRELPLRIADFCYLHRNELRGVLGGLTRVRKFSQDDAHVFCTPEQIGSEIEKLLDFVRFVYHDVFRMQFVAKLSTRPDKAMGDPELWRKAEQALQAALEKEGMKYIVKPGEGAFYGPKIDFDVKDAIGRDWQCATIQLDFQMPLRMGAMYEGADNQKHACVMIHRAILGSLERFLGVLIEHYAGKFPLWLSPEQVRILTIADPYAPYAQAVAEKYKALGIRVSVDERVETINKKVREAQLAQVNYILVVGEREQKDGTVTVRTRDSVVRGDSKVDAFGQELLKEISEKR
ncbi:threonine--tRNA ligase [Candidatus Woesearchaeota archaeon]|nr:threonine--tRNA ligase [Candidatus Woesearchaeota archaeon]